MGIIGTAVAVGIGTRVAGRSAELRQTNRSISKYNRTLPFVAWLDSLSDADAYAYACYILGASKGSRYADRVALIAHQTATAF